MKDTYVLSESFRVASTLQCSRNVPSTSGLSCSKRTIIQHHSPAKHVTTMAGRRAIWNDVPRNVVYSTRRPESYAYRYSAQSRNGTGRHVAAVGNAQSNL